MSEGGIVRGVDGEEERRESAHWSAVEGCDGNDCEDGVGERGECGMAEGGGGE